MSIFLSSVFLGLIAVYIATRDRWKWKETLRKLFITSVAFLFSAIAIVAVLSFFEERPQPASLFGTFGWGCHDPT